MGSLVAQTQGTLATDQAAASLTVPVLACTSCLLHLHRLGTLCRSALTAVRFTAVRTVLLEICRGWLPGSTVRRPRSSCVSAVLLPMVMKGEAVLLALLAGVGRLVMGSWTLARALLLQDTEAEGRRECLRRRSRGQAGEGQLTPPGLER